MWEIQKNDTACVAMLQGSGFHATYCTTSCDTFEANKSTVGVPNFRQSLSKTCRRSTHLDESTFRRDSKSTTLLSELGRYCTVMRICSEINISQI